MTAPSSTLTDPSFYLVFGIATDSKNNVYAAYEDVKSKFAVIEFPGGKMPGKILPITGYSGIVDIAFDAKENLVAIDQSAVDIYKPPYSGPPASTFPAKGYPQMGKLDPAQKNLYVSDDENYAVDVYTYPAGNFEYSISNGIHEYTDIGGIAVDSSVNN